jgi:hypothetical protein
MAVSNSIFVNKIGSGTHGATQNLVGTGEVLVMLMAGKKKVLACILLRKDFWKGVLACSVTNISLPGCKHLQTITILMHHQKLQTTNAVLSYLKEKLVLTVMFT